jgi:putative Holliday junction resolvase
MRYLAIDYGSKRTGLAICDVEQIIVSPFDVIPTDIKIHQTITDIIEENQVEAVVVGLPLNMNGSKGKQAEIVLEFVEDLRQYIDLPIELCDERLTTYSAEQKFRIAKSTIKEKKQNIDAVAAAQILQSFLDMQEEKSD